MRSTAIPCPLPPWMAMADVADSSTRVVDGCQIEFWPRTGEAERRREFHAGRGRADIVARVRDLERAFLLVELALEPGELLNLRSVQLGGTLRGQQYGDDGDHALLLWALWKRRLTSSHLMFWKKASTYLAAAAP